MSVKVIDSIMGSGKTNWAIQYMNENPDKKFMYITPYNKEISNRIIPSCPELHFKFARESHKVSDFKDMLAKGQNIVATHECFKRADEEVETLLGTYDYTLILDEVFDVVIDIKLSKCDVDNILNHYAKVENNYLVWTDDKYSSKDGRYSDIKQMAKLGNLMVFKDTFLLWLFPVRFFKKFSEVYIMTYLFPGQIQRYYFDMHNIEYEYYKVTGDRQNGYRLIDHDGIISNNLKPLVNVYDGSMNDVGKADSSLTKTWYSKTKNQLLVRTLKNNLKNYFKNLNNAKSNEIMWTCYKDSIGKLKGDGYSKGFVECNCRATNEYRTRKYVAYCINLRMRPVLKNNYFVANGINVNEDLWALSEMLQFLWRSAIREGQKINLYVPSKRMRELLDQFLDNSLAVDYKISRSNLLNGLKSA
mgnify:CR=1 FL=1